MKTAITTTKMPRRTTAAAARRALATAAAAAVTLAMSACPARADLSADVDAALRDPSVARAMVGVQVVRLGKTPGDAALIPRVVYRRDAGLPLTPASNLKLLTTSAALDHFGPGFAFRTKLVSHGADLILVGDGDPALGDAELLAPAGQDVDTAFKQWATQLRDAGVRRVRDVAVDDTVFDPTEMFQPRWPADQRLNRYEAEVAGVNLNANCLDVAVRPTSAGRPVAVQPDPRTAYAPVTIDCLTGRGTMTLDRAADNNVVTLHGRAEAATTKPFSVTIHDPPLYAATVLAEAISAGGATVKGLVHRDVAARVALARGDPAYRVLAEARTPLLAVIGRANKDSMNLYAECLCKRLGADANGGGGGSWANGTAAVGAFLRKVGVPADQFRLDDGCGLSKSNLVTAGAVTQVLTYDFASPNADAFMATLAVAGQDGTLLDRFAHSPLRGRVLAKTGHVSGVNCLSGYLHAADGQWYAFAILINRTAGGANPVEERIVKAIDADVR
jgi:D-alanyl-D-alanine carboxypeptidase/D-alanyl-D-alanine-endopeptidase (penicillin-binding protein 4)